MTPHEKEKNRMPVTEEKAYARMARICAMREYAAADIAEKLRRLELGRDAVERTVKKLEANQFIDDGRFARSFASDKLRFNKWGKIKVQFALRQKKIPQEIIDQALAEFPDGRSAETLMQLLRNKAKTIKNASEYEKRTKMIRFAISRGFSMAEILNCLKTIDSETEEEETE